MTKHWTVLLASTVSSFFSLPRHSFFLLPPLLYCILFLEEQCGSSLLIFISVCVCLSSLYHIVTYTNIHPNGQKHKLTHKMLAPTHWTNEALNNPTVALFLFLLILVYKCVGSIAGLPILSSSIYNLMSASLPRHLSFLPPSLSLLMSSNELSFPRSLLLFFSVSTILSKSISICLS